MAKSRDSYLLSDVQDNVYDHNQTLQWAAMSDSNFQHGNIFSPSLQRFQSRYLAMNLDNEKPPSQKNEMEIDYSVLSVAVMTLALIMIVQLIRHKLENLAQSRTLFRHMLDHVYTECRFNSELNLVFDCRIHFASMNLDADRNIGHFVCENIVVARRNN